jgi:glutathione synthase/RimK-type ligase-like ATP-grasp enzyme
MTKILIPSLKGDSDAMLLSTALLMRGHKTVRWVGDNYPTIDRSSYFIGNGISKFGSVKGFDFELSSEDIDVVWLRRPRWPGLPSYLHHSDREIAEQECRAYITSFYQASWRTAVWVNELEARRRANSKLLQLRFAAEIGLKIPLTLVSNDPDDIRKFLSENSGNAIVKPIIGGAFSDVHEHRITYTAEISSDALPEEKMISACPCIYQEKVSKKTEVRLTFFGAEAVAIELDSQKHKSTKLDWRAGDTRALRYRPAEIPADIYAKCRILMKRLGIIHGSFDFACHEDGSWIFFEVNEAGQFLWMEDFCPELRLLDIASEFLAAPSPDFYRKGSEPALSIHQVATTSLYKDMQSADSENMYVGGISALI